MLLQQKSAFILLNISLSCFVSSKFELHQSSRYPQYDSALGGSFSEGIADVVEQVQDLHGKHVICSEDWSGEACVAQWQSICLVNRRSSVQSRAEASKAVSNLIPTSSVRAPSEEAVVAAPAKERLHFHEYQSFVFRFIQFRIASK